MADTNEKQNEKQTITADKMIVVGLSHGFKANAELVFAYQMRDQIAVRGQLAVQKEFDAWFQQYVAEKFEAEAKAINSRIEQKKWNMVIELQKKFGYTLEQATTQIFGKPLLENPVAKAKVA